MASHLGFVYRADVLRQPWEHGGAGHTSRARPKYAGAQPTPDEAKEAITGYLAYFGTYTVDERTHTITHHRKANINPGQIGDDAVRRYEFAPGDRVILTPVDSGNRIIWERAK